MHSKEEVLKSMYGMDKQAGIPLASVASGAAHILGGTASDIVEASTRLLMLGLIGGAALGGGIGWGAAKLTSKSAEDIDLAKKEYQNERLKSDIGYLSGQLRQERDNMLSRQDPKAARVVAL